MFAPLINNSHIISLIHFLYPHYLLFMAKFLENTKLIFISLSEAMLVFYNNFYVKGA